MQEKQQVETDFHVYALSFFLFQRDGGGSTGSVKESPEEAAEGSGESGEEG